MNDAVGIIESAIRRVEQIRVCTPNAQHVVLAADDIEFRNVTNSADLCIPDGMGVVYASRWLRSPLRGTVGGRRLLEELCARAETTGWRVCLFGSADGVAARAADVLRKRHPHLNVAAVSPGIVALPNENYGQGEFPEISCEILFVALGAPKQEKWIASMMPRLDTVVAVGVGSSLDVIGGRVPFPPRWTTALGFEWLFRLVNEPGRLWRRYILGIPRFAAIVVHQRLWP